MLRKMLIALTLAAAIILSFTACERIITETANNLNAESESISTDSSIDVATDVNSSKSVSDITIDQIEYSVSEVIDDGERDVYMQCKNNSSYTINGIEITFVEKADVKDEQRQTFFTDLQETYELSDEDLEDLINQDISMYAKSKKLIPSGSEVGKIHLYYYSSYAYMRNPSHFNLVEPDIVTINYVKDGKIYTEYYDYRSDTYYMDDDVEDAFVWGKTSPLAELISKPDVEVCKVEFDLEDIFWFYAYGCSHDDYDAYVEDCKANGFTIDAEALDNFFYASDENGNTISIGYDEDDGSISVDIDAPEDIDAP